MTMLTVAVITIIVIVLLVALKTRKTSKDGDLTFENKGALFSPAERSFLGVLEQVLDNQYRVFGKVRLGDIVKPAKGLSNSKRVTAQNKINQKHVDYVICQASDLSVVGVVELDDQSHGRDDRADRDKLVDQALAGAKILIAHFSAKKGYVVAEVRSELNKTLHLATTLSTVMAQSEPQTVHQEAQIKIVPTIDQPEDNSPNCPKCSALMVKR